MGLPVPLLLKIADRRAEIAPARMQGVPVQLPLSCFRLRDHRFPDQAVPGRLPQVEQLGLLWHPTCYQQGQSFDWILSFERRPESPTSFASRVRVALDNTR